MTAAEARPPQSAGRRLIAVMTGTSVVSAGAASFAALWATRVLGPTPRGVMILAITTAGMVSLLGGLGTGAAFRAQLPLASPESRERLARAYAWVSVVGSLVAALVSVGVMLAAAAVITPALGGAHLLAVVSASTFVQCLTTQGLEAWFAEGHFQRGSWLTAAAAGLGMGGLMAAGAISRTPTAMIIGDLLFEAAVMLVSVTWLARERLWVFARPRPGDVRDLVRRGWPSIGVGVGIVLIFRADRYVLGAFEGAAAVTLYSTAATLAEAARTIPHQLGQVFIRQVAERGGEVSLRRTVYLALAATVATGAVVGVVGWLAIPVVFGRDLRDARDYLLLLLAAEVLFCPFFVASRGLVGGGWTRATGVIGGVGCVAAVAGYLVAVPTLGITGACIASAVTYLGLSIATVWALEVRLAERTAHDAGGAPPTLGAAVTGQTAGDAILAGPNLPAAALGDGPLSP